MKITSPAKGYTGKDQYGDVVLDFNDGVAEFDGDLPHGVRQYLTGAGYGLGSKRPEQPEGIPTPADPRDQTTEQVGTRLRDAAVDPEPEDFLPPTNAGEEGELGNPHGPCVVAPGIHAVSGPGPIVPGTVGDADYQNAKETAVAEAVLVDQRDATEVAQALGELVERELVEQQEAAADGDDDAAAGFAEKAEGIDDQSDVDSIIDEGIQGIEAETNGEPEPDVELKGQALEDALEERGLPKTGSADEKRARVSEHDAAAKGQG